jgi:Dynamin central region/Dynamin family
MTNSRSIIMVVISANTDASNQEILRMAKKIDPDGERTLAIITKPDMLSSGSDAERTFISYAKNDTPNFTFRHGWHVIKNRKYETRHQSLFERDEDERMFFANSIWENVLGPEFLGINALRARLSTLLEDHTRALLPAVISSITELSDSCQEELERLGPSRETPEQQRLYLIDTSERFQRLVEQGVEANYLDEFFSPGVETHIRHLRATIQNMNELFVDLMIEKGHAKEFRYSSVLTAASQDSSSSIPDDIFTTLPRSITRPYYETIGAPLPTTDDSHLREIEVWVRETRGRELPTLFSPNLVGPVFRQQSSKWESMANLHIETTWKATTWTLSSIARHVTNEETASRLLRHVINVELDKKRLRMFEKLSEMLTPYKKLHPISYDPSFAEEVELIKKMTSQITTLNLMQSARHELENSDDGDDEEDEDYDPNNIEDKDDEAESEHGPGHDAEWQCKAAFNIWAYANAYYQVCLRTTNL